MTIHARYVVFSVSLISIASDHTARCPLGERRLSLSDRTRFLRRLLYARVYTAVMLASYEARIPMDTADAIINLHIQ